MAVITPNTDVILLKVPLELDEINQLTFANATAQYNYFYNLPNKLVFDTKFTYQRKDNSIKVEATVDDLYDYNYVMYRNTNHSNKWFYAFITNMEYVSDKVTSLTLKTDVWQTWQFQLTFKPVLIDREHTNDDTVGANTLPEGLELGEMVANGNTQNFGINSNDIQKFLVIADVTMVENSGTEQTLTFSWSDNSTTMPDSYVNGIPSGCYHIIIGEGGSYHLPSIGNFISVYEKAGLADAITSIYVLPKNILGPNDYKTGLTISTTGAAPLASATGLSVITSSGLDPELMNTFNVIAPSTINTYTPKNNKLLSYPYCYFNVSNNAGTSVPYHYEDFSYSIQTRWVTFRVEGVCCQGGSVKAVPENYKNITDNASSISSTGNAYDYSVTGAKYPICSWTTDSYTNWLTQNAVNMNAQWTSTLIAGAIGIGATALTAGLGAAALGMGTVGAALYGAAGGAIKAGGDLIGTAREQHLAKTQANLVPDQCQGNANVGDLVFSKLYCQFTYIPMSIKAEYARCIDEYFSQFGYKCNRVKVPNITGRTNWNYVKTIGCYIKADIPQDDLQEIKNMFDRGVTFWHNPSTFMDYTQSNAIVTP